MNNENQIKKIIISLFCIVIMCVFVLIIALSASTKQRQVVGTEAIKTDRKNTESTTSVDKEISTEHYGWEDEGYVPGHGQGVVITEDSTTEISTEESTMSSPVNSSSTPISNDSTDTTETSSETGNEHNTEVIP